MYGPQILTSMQKLRKEVVREYSLPEAISKVVKFSKGEGGDLDELDNYIREKLQGLRMNIKSFKLVRRLIGKAPLVLERRELYTIHSIECKGLNEFSKACHWLLKTLKKPSPRNFSRVAGHFSKAEFYWNISEEKGDRYLKEINHG